EKEIEAAIQKEKVKSNTALSYVEGETFHQYLNDMGIAQTYAEYNRKAIAEVIIREMGFHVVDSFTTIHNYIDLDQMVLRKGAISAKKGEVVLIPINMRDGSL
ncbi:MAG TPA: RNA-splicing ligase RtcB, partial [Paenibacillaceae bacterium]|nr:RNA-splicing ligase RtcB [Paenibacillaceae bacterium]